MSLMASEKASALGLWLYCGYALRDLKLLVLDPAGRVEEGEHASRRLGAVLRRLRSPADVLTKYVNRQIMEAATAKMGLRSMAGRPACAPAAMGA